MAANYDDGGYSGGNLERPALKRLMADIRAGQVQTVVVYKVDRLTRSLSDFARLIELFEARGVRHAPWDNVDGTQQLRRVACQDRWYMSQQGLPSRHAI